MVPMHSKKRKEALHEPTKEPPGFGLRQSSGAFRQDALATVHPPPRFMVPMHSKKRKEALHEPTKEPPGFGLRQSSGAFRQDALATVHPPPRFMVPMHAKKRKEALQKRRLQAASTFAGPGGTESGVNGAFPRVFPGLRPVVSGGAREDLQPKRFEQSHPHDILTPFAHGDVVEKNPLQLETKPAVEIEVVDVDVARVDVNLVQVQDQEGVVEKAERGPFADAFALQAGFADELFHLQFAGQGVYVLAPDDADRLVLVIDPEILPRGMREVFLQINFLFRKGRHEALADCGIFEPFKHPGDERRSERPERHMLNGQLLALLPFILEGRECENLVVILYPRAGFLLLRHEIIEQMGRDSQDFAFLDAVIDEFVVKSLGDQLEHLVALLLGRKFFVVLFVQRHIRLEYWDAARRRSHRLRAEVAIVSAIYACSFDSATSVERARGGRRPVPPA